MEFINGATALYLSCMAGTPKGAFVVIPEISRSDISLYNQRGARSRASFVILIVF